MSYCQFINPDNRLGIVKLTQPENRKKLYFPLFNEAGIMSSVTPNLKGDLKLSQNHFHTHPVVTEDLYNTNISRNFWIVPEDNQPWSATGVSADQAILNAIGNAEQSFLIARAGLFEVERTNKDLEIKANIKIFVPSNNDPLEVILVTIKNFGNKEFKFSAIPAIPIYARSADNQRDHRQVTTLLNRIFEIEGGVNVRPTMSFDERGHKENFYNYAVLAFDENGEFSSKKYTRLMDYIGVGSLDAPEAIYQEFNPPKDIFTDGKEAIGAFAFENQKLASGEEKLYIVLNVITDNEQVLESISQKYRTKEQVLTILEDTKKYWEKRVKQISFETKDLNFDNWMSWITFQPMARKIFGCSFLPDFGYGRGGRGWRDLWQDSLALILTSPDETTEMLYQNFAGIRADGSNATIIGANAGEFIADRNNISRTWMDHGVWPLLTTNLYINQSGNLGFLLKTQTYFKDLQSHRSQKKDKKWNSEYGNKLLNQNGEVYFGSIIEHLLIQNVTQFFNVGAHNICKLEDADWNDGLDMASEKGESVAFHCMYMHNLNMLADYLKALKIQRNISEIEIMQEAKILFDTLENHINYSNFEEKQKLLANYMTLVMHKVSGKKIKIDIDNLVADLITKAEAMKKVVLDNEIIKVKDGYEFFNGYYNNDGEQVEGDNIYGVRMTLTGQVFPIMSGLASDEQIRKSYEASKKYLKDPQYGGYRLNTNFGELALNLGRAFSFSYGDKENGASFSHMIVMFIYALYSRGFVKEGYEVFQSIYKMCMDFETNKILPSIPEYFDAEGRGAYLYLTGSASWMVLVVTTQIFGVTAKLGDLMLEPKLVADQLGSNASIITSFQGKRIKVEYRNGKKLDYGKYVVKSVAINGKVLTDLDYGNKMVIIPKYLFEKNVKKDILNVILVELG